MYIVLCTVVFLVTYLLNSVTVTVGYHRGFSHHAVSLRPLAKRLLVATGVWVTGLDAKAWVVMHRLHHAHSDTPLDPHSPRNVGLWGIPLEQLRGYQRTIDGLARSDPAYTRYAVDLDFKMGWLLRRGLWFVPYLVHLAFGVLLGVTAGWALALCYVLGSLSHPVGGAVVNALGHAIGGRNFDTDDNSHNNHFAAWLLLGEGFQNNHHHAPASARFSYAPGEVDCGWGVCLALERLGVIEIHRNSVLPRFQHAAE